MGSLESSPTVPSGSAGAPVATPGAPSPTRAPSFNDADNGPFQVTDAGIFWTCPRCETRNLLERSVCEVCGTAFAELVRPPEPELEPRDPNTAALVSLFFPGAGHWYLGLRPQAVARAIVSLWVVSVVIVAGIQRGVAGSVLIAVAFGLVAFGLWGVAAHDAYREARRETDAVLLKGRAFIYVVLGLLVLLVVLMLPAIFQIRAG